MPAELTALLVAPNRELAGQFTAALARSRAFQILAETKSYPSQQTLEIRIKQLQPDVLLLDLSGDLEAAGDLIRFTAGLRPPVFVVGLHTHNDSEVILRSLRLGASEFLFAPFDPLMQQEAVARIRRLKAPEPATEQDQGKLVVFSSTKPGSGASTLAMQTAFALRRATGKRVLLADFDLSGGALAFYLKLHHRASLVDALAPGALDPTRWAALTAACGGVDVLPAPEMPYADAVDPARLQEVLQSMRLMYEWAVVDLPVIFSRLSLLALSESDKAFLVSTSELPSLHLTRKAVGLLAQLGFGKDKFQVVVNRINKRDGIGSGEMAKLFECPVHASFPNDYFSLHRVITLGRPLAGDCELGRAIEGLAGRLSGAVAAEKRRSGALLDTKPLLSES